jgi:cation transport ATPase-like protein
MSNQEPEYYWSIPTADIFRQINGLESEGERERQKELGLASSEANLRLTKYGKNVVEAKKKTGSLTLLIFLVVLLDCTFIMSVHDCTPERGYCAKQS